MKKKADVQFQFEAAVDQAQVQVRTFQAVFEAMAFPGRIVPVGSHIPVPPLLNSASAAICLTWLNTSTPFWTDIPWDAPAVHWIQNYSGAALVTESCMATLALINEPETMPPLNAFGGRAACRGSVFVTLIIQVSDPTSVVEFELNPQFRPLWRVNAGRPSSGVDILLTFQDCIVVPRPAPDQQPGSRLPG